MAPQCVSVFSRLWKRLLLACSTPFMRLRGHLLCSFPQPRRWRGHGTCVALCCLHKTSISSGLFCTPCCITSLSVWTEAITTMHFLLDCRRDLIFYDKEKSAPWCESVGVSDGRSDVVQGFICCFISSGWFITGDFPPQTRRRGSCWVQGGH